MYKSILSLHTVTFDFFIYLFLFSSLQDGEKLAEYILKSVLTLSTVYYWLPKSQGNSQNHQNNPGIVSTFLLMCTSISLFALAVKRK